LHDVGDLFEVVLPARRERRLMIRIDYSDEVDVAEFVRRVPTEAPGEKQADEPVIPFHAVHDPRDELTLIHTSSHPLAWARRQR